eukprot:6479577-Amphidinium_carterae.1
MGFFLRMKKIRAGAFPCTKPLTHVCKTIANKAQSAWSRLEMTAGCLVNGPYHVCQNEDTRITRNLKRKDHYSNEEQRGTF